MIALFGGPIVRCAKYAPAGTKELAGSTLEALNQGHAVLLSNYGALTTGATLEAALVRAQELETLARLYAIALLVGRPAILSDEEVDAHRGASQVQRRRRRGANRRPPHRAQARQSQTGVIEADLLMLGPRGLTNPAKEGLALQRPLPEAALRIIARGEKSDGARASGNSRRCCQ